MEGERPIIGGMFGLAEPFARPRLLANARCGLAVLAELLNRWALYPHLPPGVVPIGFPIRIPHRDEIRGLFLTGRSILGKMELVDTKVEVHYKTEVSGWKGFQESFTQRSLKKKR